MKRHGMLILVAGLLIAAEKPKKEDGSADAKKLQGTWSVIKAVHNGEAAPDEKIQQVKVAFKDDKFTLNEGGQDHEVTFKLDPTKKPRTMDAVPADGKFKGKTLQGIYALEGDELKLCLAQPGKERPTKFESTANSGHFLLVMKRSKS